MSGSKLRIPPSLRWIVHLVLATLVAMLLGALAERIPISGLTNYLASVQRSAFDGVRAFDPFMLGNLYACSFNPPSAGDCLPTEFTEETTPPGFVTTSPLVNGTLQERIERNVLSAPEPRILIGLGHWANFLRWPLGIPFAAADVFYHLVLNTTLTASLFAIAQFVLGFLAMSIWGAKLAEHESNESFVVFSLPIGTILFGCCFGYVTKWAMIGGANLFEWATHLGGLSTGLALAGSLGVTFSQRLMETALHEKVTEAVENRIFPEDEKTPSPPGEETDPQEPAR